MPNNFAVGTKMKQKQPKGQMPNYKLETFKIQSVRRETAEAFDELLGWINNNYNYCGNYSGDMQLI